MNSNNGGSKAMQKRPNAVTFKGKPHTLVGPQLKPGDKAPDFACATSSLEIVGIAATPPKARMFCAVPSLDTGVCSEETKKFNEVIAGFKDKVACYTVSLVPEVTQHPKYENAIAALKAVA